MQLSNYTLYRTVLALAASSPDQEVQYNCAGIIGHLAVDGTGEEGLMEGRGLWGGMWRRGGVWR